jgi:hypothetical protein
MKRAVRRLVGLAVRTALGAAALLIAQPPNRLTAQIGHDPGSSPYHDVLLHPVFSVYGGHLSGDRGRVDAGVSNAQTIGVRYEIPSGKSMLFQFHAAYLMGDRFIIDPRADSASPGRKTGPYESNLVLTEIALNHRLMGGKMWRRWGPYVGVALGLVFDVHSPGDTTNSGYTFGTKVGLAGAVGTRWYPTRRRLVVNAEARMQAWRLKYPVSFHTTLAPDGSRVVPITQSLTDWTWHPWLSLGIGWTF